MHKIFSGPNRVSNNNSTVLCTNLSGLGIARIIKWFNGCKCNSAFSTPWISKASLNSKKIFRFLFLFYDHFIRALNFIFLSVETFYNKSINLIYCLWIYSFSMEIIFILSLCSWIFWCLSCFFISTNSITYRTSKGLFCPSCHFA